MQERSEDAQGEGSDKEAINQRGRSHSDSKSQSLDSQNKIAAVASSSTDLDKKSKPPKKPNSAPVTPRSLVPKISMSELDGSLRIGSLSTQLSPRSEPSSSSPRNQAKKSLSPEERKRLFRAQKGKSATETTNQKAAGHSFSLLNFLQKKSKPTECTRSEKDQVIQEPVEREEKAVEQTKSMPSALSLKLDVLIDPARFPELYGRTIHWPNTIKNNEKKIKAFCDYVILTPESTLQFIGTLFLNKIEKMQLKKIKRLKELYDEILDPLFQEYLKETSDVDLQAQRFCNYMRDRIDAAMFTSLVQKFPLLQDNMNYKDKRLFQPEEVQFIGVDSRLLELQLAVRAIFQLQGLKFHEYMIPAYTNNDNSIASVLAFIIERIDKERVKLLYDNIYKKTLAIAQEDWKYQQDIKAYELMVTKGVVPGFVSLSKLMPFVKTPITLATKKAVIQGLRDCLKNEISEFDSKTRSNKSPCVTQINPHLIFPTITDSENEFYFRKESPFVKLIKEKINTVMNKNLKLFGDKGQSIHTDAIPEVVKKLVPIIRETLLTPIEEINEISNICRF